MSRGTGKDVGAGSLNFNLQATILDYYGPSSRLHPSTSKPIGQARWARREPHRYQRRRVRLSAVRLGQLRAQQLEPGAADAVSAGGVYCPIRRASRRSRRTTTPWWPVDRASCSATRRQRSTSPNDYSIFDLSFGWNINDMISLRGGITNLFDTEPEVVGASKGYPIGTNLQGVCPGLGVPAGLPEPHLPTACQARQAACRPRSYKPGYYDTLGRRFFLGMSVRF